MLVENIALEDKFFNQKALFFGFWVVFFFFHFIRARDKGSIRVKYPNILRKYSIIFKNLGIDTQLILQSTQLLPN